MVETVLLGASGAVGREVLAQLLLHPQVAKVLIYVRKSLLINHPKLTEVVTELDHYDLIEDSLKGQVLISCLGSTKRKTPDQATYYKIDHDYPLYFAKAMLDKGLQQMHLISAIGANPTSSNFYMRMKGVIEADLKALAIPSLNIYQPSLIVAPRSDKRLLEKISKYVMQVLNPLLKGSMEKYKSLSSKDIATALVNNIFITKDGIHEYLVPDILVLRDKIY